jgi:hypothetical protein
MNKIYLYILLIFGIIYLFKNYYNTETNIILKDHMEGKESDEDGGCEKKSIHSDYKKAWTEEQVSKNTKYYTSDIKDEKTDTGMFFNKNNEFVDITSYKSNDVIPDKCFYENGVLNCQFNDKLQNIPPSLIEDPESNPLLLSIGDDKNINTNKLSKEVFSFNGNSYNVWDYGDESSSGYNNDSTPLKIDDMRKNYAL